MQSLQVRHRALSDEVLDVGPFKEVMSSFATGVTVVTSFDDCEPVGFACQSFVSLSLDPPLVAFAASRCSRSWPRIARSGRFCVNVLSSDQAEVCRAFATSGTDKFTSTSWHLSGLGSPLLAGALAWADCELEAIHDAGDHELAIGLVRQIGRTGSSPLVYFRRTFGEFASFEG